MSSFEALGLSAPLIRWIETEGFTTPTEIQAKAIPLLLDGRDLLGTAQTGEGKTAAYLLPILNRLTQDGEAVEPPTPRRPQVLILAPTRELASQIGDALRQFSKGMRVYYTVVFGGSRFLTQQKVMDRGVQILIATPGRLMDHHRRGTIRLDRVTTFVLDEADRMLDMGFVNEVKEIAGLVPTAHQTVMFSATMSRGVRELASTLLHNPERLDVGKSNAVAANVDHRVMRVQYRDKKPLLMHLLGREDVTRVLIFTRTKAMADVLSADIQEAGLAADAIHGDREQSMRQKVLKDFRDGTVNILVATDVAARGIDVPDITHVINYDMPIEGDSYVHRVGRTGRAGAKGTALSIVTGSEGNLVRIVERVIGQRIPVDIDHPFHDARPDDSRGYESPNGKRFGKKDGAKPSRKGPRDGGERREFAPRGVRTERSEHPARAERAERPARAERTPRHADGERPQDRFAKKSDKPFHKGPRDGGERREFTPRTERPERAERPARAERTERPARSEHAERPAYQDREDRKPRPERPFRQEGERPFRQEGERPARQDGERSFKKDGERPHKKDGERSFKKEGGRPFRKDGERPFAKRADGKPDRPFHAKPRAENDRGDDRRDHAPRPERSERAPRSEWRPENNRVPQSEGERPFKRADKKFDKKSDKKFGGPRRGDDRADERRSEGAVVRAKDGVTAFRAADAGGPSGFKKKKPSKKKEEGGETRAARADVPQKKRADMGKKRPRPFETERRATSEANAGGFKPRTRRPS